MTNSARSRPGGRLLLRVGDDDGGGGEAGTQVDRRQPGKIPRPHHPQTDDRRSAAATGRKGSRLSRPDPAGLPRRKAGRVRNVPRQKKPDIWSPSALSTCRSRSCREAFALETTVSGRSYLRMIKELVANGWCRSERLTGSEERSRGIGAQFHPKNSLVPQIFPKEYDRFFRLL